jgi:hypothetical protein
MRFPTARLIAAWTVTHFGYRAAVIALPLLALQETGSAWTVGLVAGAAGVPTITAPWWTRGLQRRLGSASALAALLAAEGLATLVVPVSALLGTLSPPLMIGSGLAVGALNALSGPLDSALLAAVGDRRDPRHGAAQLLAVQETSLRAAMTLAPLATLPLIAWIGTAPTVALEGLLSLVGAGLVATVRMRITVGDDEEIPGVRGLLGRHPEVRLGWLVRGTGCAAWFAFTLGLAVLGAETGRGLLLATVGITSYSLGSLAGSLGGILAARSRRPALLNSAAWTAAGVGWLVMAARPTPVVIAATAVVMGLVIPAGNAATAALVTRATTGAGRRAALTAQATVVAGSSTLGSLVGGPIIAVCGARAAIGGAGAVVLVVAVGVAVRSARQLPAPPAEVGPFGLVLGEGQRGVVGRPRLLGPAQSAEQVGAGRVPGVVAVEREPVHLGQRHRRAVELGHDDRAVERDDGGGRDGVQLGVERGDLVPVRVGGCGCVGVDRVDGREQLVLPGPSDDQALTHQVVALGDEVVVPAAAVLLLEGDQLAVGHPHRTAGLGEQHQREQAGHLRDVGQQGAKDAGEPDRLGSQLVSDR